MGEVIDLFTRQRVGQGGNPPHPEDFADEAEFVERFRDVYLGDFIVESIALQEAESVDELESQIIRIKRLVAKWPSMPSRE